MSRTKMRDLMVAEWSCRWGTRSRLPVYMESSVSPFQHWTHPQVLFWSIRILEKWFLGNGKANISLAVRCLYWQTAYVFQYLSMFYMNAVMKDRYQLYNYSMHVKIQCGKCVHLYEKLDLHDMHLLIWVLHLAHLWGTKNTVFLAIFALACLHGIISKLWYLTWHFCAVHFRWFRLHLYSAQSLFGND